MFAADPDLEVPPDFAALLDAHPHELADPVAVDRLERVVREDALLDVVQEELRLRVVAAVPHRRLGQVVRPEREEFGVMGDCVGDESGPRDFDHRAELVGHRDPLALHDLLRLVLEGVSFDPQLLGQTHQRDHDLGPHIDAFFLEPTRRLEDRPDLHLRDLREHDSEATAAETEHRVRLAGPFDRLQEAFLPRQQRFDPLGEIGTGLADFRDQHPILFRRRGSDEGLGILPRDPQLGHLNEQRLVPRQEFVKRGVDQADDDREPGHLSEDSDEILALHPTEVVQGSDVPPREIFQAGIDLGDPSLEVSTPVVRRRLKLFGQGLPLPLDLPVLRRGEDHLMDDREPVGLHEHVFRPIQSDPLSPELAGAGRVSRIVGVCPDLETPDLVPPPRAVRTPLECRTPCTSSGEVSTRTKITGFRSSRPNFSASSGSKATIPIAAPGDALRPLARKRPDFFASDFALSSNWGKSRWITWSGSTRRRASSFEMSPSRTMSRAIRTVARAGGLAARVWSIHSFPRSTVNSMS